MARRRVNTTKHEIIQTATRLFLEKGYSSTTPKLICEELDISTGNLTYYFPTKEDLLAVLVEMLCKFQSELLQSMVEEEDTTSLLAACLELATMVAICDENEVVKDFFVSTYSSPKCLELIRKNDTERSKYIYRPYCSDWSDLQFVEAEILVFGIEYATLITTADVAPLETRISGALNNIMTIYTVPAEVRHQKIQKVFSFDYKNMGKRILEQFKAFVEQTNEHTFETLLAGK